MPPDGGAGRLSVAELIALDDLDGLLRRIDALCDAEAWDDLSDLRHRCRRAFADTGRQLWPAAANAEYRLALGAPGPFAASVLVAGAGRFALGPLPEVAASTHAWADLSPHLGDTPEAGRFAEERVARGEDLTASTLAGAALVSELPLRLQAWEPAYPVATYKADKLTVADVARPPMAPFGAGRPDAAPIDDALSADALADLASVWTTQSDGRCRVAAVDGDAADAVASLTSEPVMAAEVDLGQAMAAMAWAAAGGGARGRRRGLAYGRFAAWWAAAALGGLDADEWPHAPDEVGEAASALRWLQWSPTGPDPGGWALRLAVESVETSEAWAIEATDTL